MAVGARWIATLLAGSAVLASVWAGVRIWSTPMRYEVVDATVDGAGANHRFETRRVGTLPLSIPVVITGLGAWAAYRRRRWSLVLAAVVLALFAAVAGFSIGGAYLPSVCGLAVASLVALATHPTPTSESRGAA